jgi:hypothetical protein
MGALLVSLFNVEWGCYAWAGGVEESVFCLFLVVFPARCISSISSIYFKACFLLPPSSHHLGIPSTFPYYVFIIPFVLMLIRLMPISYALTVGFW